MIDTGQKFRGGEPATDMQLSCLTYRAPALNGGSLSLRQNGNGIGGGHRLWKPLAAEGECGRAAATGQEAEMADFDETCG